MRIHHIGIACTNVEESILEFAKFHTILSKSEIIYDELQNAQLCMIKSDTGLDVEFISGEQVSRMLKKGINFYHLCYEVDNIKSTVQDFVNNGAMLISDIKPAVLFNNRKVAFLFVSYGLIELVESENKENKYDK